MNKLYLAEGESSGALVALDDMILTKDYPTTAGSKMLDGYMSLFNAEVVDRLTEAGYAIAGKVNVGEFSIDLLGESSYMAECQGELHSASAEAVKGDIKALVGLDVNGMQRRAAALDGLVYVKPTYGTVSRFGTVPVVCSGESVGVMAKSAADCKEVLCAIAGHDDKDGTSLPEAQCAAVKEQAAPIRRVAIVKSVADSADPDAKARIEAMKTALQSMGIEVCQVEGKSLTAAKEAWSVLMCAELCNNVSRYDGVKYGYRTKNYKTIEELYTGSRTEAFGLLLKSAILYGSSVLSAGNYMKMYDKAQRVRRVIAEELTALTDEYDALLIPACSKTAYTADDVKADPYIAFEEAQYTAPASLCGIPAVVFGGVQFLGKAFSEGSLLDLAKKYEEEAGK